MPVGLGKRKKNTKGNRKGSLNSYHVRKTLFLSCKLGLIIVLLCFLVDVLEWRPFGVATIRSAGSGVQVSVLPFLFADAATTTEQVEVDWSGRTKRRESIEANKEEELLKSQINDAIEKVGEEDVPKAEKSLDKYERNAESIERLEKNRKEEANSVAHTYSLNKTPTLKYGTAWKKDRTAELVRKAIHAGFRHIDTACQPKHYNEAGVGEGWSSAAYEMGLQRSDIWIQTKFTSVSGQDPNQIPYDQNASLEDQVRESLRKSLENLKTDYIDSLVIHGPEKDWEGTLRVWAVFEELVRAGVVKQIGVANAWDVEFVQYLHMKATIKPAVVQQRFHSDTQFEVKTREFCTRNNIEFQSFWTLGANMHALHNQSVREMAQSKGLTPETLLYAFCLTIGITVLDGTTSEQHMREDIALLNRINSGDKIFGSERELTLIAETLGIPDWNKALT